jgi:hypothetical protein
MHRADLTLQLLLDQAAIYDLIVRYARGVDERDFDMVASCFAPDVRVSGWADQEFTNRDDLIEFISGVRYFDWTMHFFRTSAIAVSGDRATADSHAMLAHRKERPGREPILYNVDDAVYVERLERRDENWVIVARGGEPVAAAATAMPTVDDLDAPTNDERARRLLDRSQISKAVAAAYPGHLLGNQWYDIDDVDTANALIHTYAITPDDGRPWFERCVILCDRLRRSTDSWVRQ